jgi:hypothetical protein
MCLLKSSRRMAAGCRCTRVVQIDGAAQTSSKPGLLALALPGLDLGLLIVSNLLELIERSFLHLLDFFLGELRHDQLITLEDDPIQRDRHIPLPEAKDAPGADDDEHLVAVLTDNLLDLADVLTIGINDVHALKLTNGNGLSLTSRVGLLILRHA